LTWPNELTNWKRSMSISRRLNEIKKRIHRRVIIAVTYGPATEPRNGTYKVEGEIMSYDVLIEQYANKVGIHLAVVILVVRGEMKAANNLKKQ
jgi:hypothetical protein